jgi:hypothetical protein
MNHYRVKLILIAGFALISLSACTLNLNNSNKNQANPTPVINSNNNINTQTSSLYGKVTLSSGNCMPIVCDQPPCPTTCSNSGVLRHIYIRQPVGSNNMDTTYLKDATKSELIKTATSNAAGQYTVQLPNGTYSIFAEDEGKEYCNSFDGQGNACLVEIKNGQSVNLDILISHAVY